MRRYLSILGAVLLVATACGSQPPATTSQAPAASASQKPVQGGRIVEGVIEASIPVPAA